MALSSFQREYTIGLPGWECYSVCMKIKIIFSAQAIINGVYKKAATPLKKEQRLLFLYFTANLYGFIPRHFEISEITEPNVTI
jgi:hypothetical protein